MNYKTLILGIIIGLLFGVSIAYFSFSSPKLQVCPDEWISDQMPGSSGSEYFIIKGKRAEISSFDMDWVKKNCDIKLQVVV